MILQINEKRNVCICLKKISVIRFSKRIKYFDKLSCSKYIQYINLKLFSNRCTDTHFSDNRHIN